MLNIRTRGRKVSILDSYEMNGLLIKWQKITLEFEMLELIFSISISKFYTGTFSFSSFSFGAGALANIVVYGSYSCPSTAIFS